MMNVPDFLKTLMISLKRLKSLMNVPDFLKTVMNVPDFRRFPQISQNDKRRRSKRLKNPQKGLKIHQRFAQEGYTHEADEAS